MEIERQNPTAFQLPDEREQEEKKKPREIYTSQLLRPMGAKLPEEED